MNRLLLITVISLTGFFAHAQEISVGAKGGLNFANISNISGDDRVSGHLGLFLNAKMNRNWHIQPELLYSWEGQRYWDGAQYTTALNYVTIPLMFQYYPVRGFYLEFGPQLGLLAAAHDKGPDGHNADIKENFHKEEVSLDFGAGFRATQQLGFYGRFTAGVTNISAIDNYSYTNGVFQLGVEYRFQQ